MLTAAALLFQELKISDAVSAKEKHLQDPMSA